MGAGQWTSGTRSGIFRRVGAGGWEQLTKGLPAITQVQAITLHPKNRDTIYIGTQDGPYGARTAGTDGSGSIFPSATCRCGRSSCIRPIHGDSVPRGREHEPARARRTVAHR